MNKKKLVIPVLCAASLFFGQAHLWAGGQQSENTASSVQQKINTTGFPIVNDKISLNFLVPRNALNAVAFGDLAIYKQYEDKTNIHINFDEVPEEGWNERYRLSLASDDLPDVFAPGNVGMDDTYVATYIRQGAFRQLDDLIDQYSINAKKWLGQRPDMKKFITSSDGHIYNLPHIDENLNLLVNDMVFINKTWLDQLKLPIPKTLDDYVNYLRAVKAMGKIPLSWGIPAGANVSRLSCLFGSFGITEDGNRMFVTDDDKVLYAPTTPEYKTALQYYSGIYAEGLIDPESFTQNMTQLKAKSKGAGIGSSIAFWYPDLNDGEQSPNEYIIVGPFTGPQGKSMWVKNGYIPGVQRNAFLITKTNKYPEATMRWVDYWLDNSYLAIEMRFGPENVTWAKLPNDKWTELAVAPDGSPVVRKYASQFTSFGVVVPYWQYADLWSRKDITAPQATMRGDAIRSSYGPVVSKPMPPFTFSDEDNKTVSQIQTSLNTYVASTYATFVTQGFNDSQWQAFVARCQQLGSDKLVALFQQYYNQFNGIK